ncbi:unnamed protein product, partial [Trichogramma brassicae]
IVNPTGHPGVQPYLATKRRGCRERDSCVVTGGSLGRRWRIRTAWPSSLPGPPLLYSTGLSFQGWVEDFEISAEPDGSFLILLCGYETVAVPAFRCWRYRSKYLRDPRGLCPFAKAQDSFLWFLSTDLIKR